LCGFLNVLRVVFVLHAAVREPEFLFRLKFNVARPRQADQLIP
jgi:hypothetical protein